MTGSAWAELTGNWRALEQQGHSAGRPTFRHVYADSEAPLVAPLLQRCNTCGTQRGAHLGVEHYCPEWALREAWGK